VSEGVEAVEPAARELHASSWGMGKDLSTWDSPLVADVAFSARRAELRTVAAAAGQSTGLERAARELLALQSSDWAFQVTRALAADYPLERVRGHAEDHDAALRALKDSDPALRNLAPHLDLAPLCAP
jgi:1,4-alpha-glucan branching enzyme